MEIISTEPSPWIMEAAGKMKDQDKGETLTNLAVLVKSQISPENTEFYIATDSQVFLRIVFPAGELNRCLKQASEARDSSVEVTQNRFLLETCNLAWEWTSRNEEMLVIQTEKFLLLSVDCELSQPAAHSKSKGFDTDAMRTPQIASLVKDRDSKKNPDDALSQLVDQFTCPETQSSPEKEDGVLIQASNGPVPKQLTLDPNRLARQWQHAAADVPVQADSALSPASKLRLLETGRFEKARVRNVRVQTNVKLTGWKAWEAIKVSIEHEGRRPRSRLAQFSTPPRASTPKPPAREQQQKPSSNAKKHSLEDFKCDPELKRLCMNIVLGRNT